MESLLEKITLYDVIGYGIPGCVFLAIIAITKEVYLLPQVIQVYENFTAVVIFTCLVFGYVIGILMSEISRICVDIVFGKITGFILVRILKKNCGNILIEPQMVDLARLKSILVTRGVLKVNSNDNSLIEQHLSTMYSDIQTDSEYKRIHNYASAATMYKNMTMSFLSGGIATIVFSSKYLNVGVACIIGAMLYLVRWYRFEKKKNNYTVLWFMEKYA